MAFHGDNMVRAGAPSVAATLSQASQQTPKDAHASSTQVLCGLPNHTGSLAQVLSVTMSEVQAASLRLFPH